VLPETDLNGATIAAERFRLLVADMMIPVEDHTIKITSSFGIASISHDTDKTYLTTEDMIQAADRCLYKAKDRGRNRTIGTAI